MKRACRRRTLKAERYRMIKIKKISLKNQKLRVEYDHRHKDETIDSFWQYVHFTNEARLNSNETYSKRILREEGTRYETRNMQFMLNMKEVKLHFAASIFWHHKSPLLFYNDEHDSSFVIIKKSLKSRKSKYETMNQHHQRVVEWEISLSHDSEIKSKRNSMTQTYYIEKLSFVYANLINETRIYHDRMSILQENNDNSHETRSKDNVVVRFKADNWISTLSHLSQSSDLNSFEDVWNILKQRVKRRQWRIVAQLKKALIEKWKKITIEEIRARISEMSERCKLLIETDDKAIKSHLW